MKTDDDMRRAVLQLMKNRNLPLSMSNCISVQMGQVAIARGGDKKHLLSTFGLGPCHAIVVYNTKTKTGALAHVDSLCELTVLHDVIREHIDSGDDMDIKIAIISGHGDCSLESRIDEKIGVLGLSHRITSKNIGNGIASVSLDVQNGGLGNIKCKIETPDVLVERREMRVLGNFPIRFTGWSSKEYPDKPIVDGISAGKSIVLTKFPAESTGNTFDNYI